MDGLPYSARQTGRGKLKLTSGSDVVIAVIIDGTIRAIPSMVVGSGN